MSGIAENNVEQLAINTIRTLSMDAVQAANSGHPGTPMALAPIAHLLYNEQLRLDTGHPAGHASMLLYSILHLTGVKQMGLDGVLDEPAVSLCDFKNFRQMNRRWPWYPEHGHASGGEIRSGSLGQGIASGVGMAIASSWLAGRCNRLSFEIFGYNVYAVCGDGDMMEGVSAEVARLAGHLKLSNLCWIYDDNKITVEGDTSQVVFACVKAFVVNDLRLSALEAKGNESLDAVGYAIFGEGKFSPTCLSKIWNPQISACNDGSNLLPRKGPLARFAYVYASHRQSVDSVQLHRPIKKMLDISVRQQCGSWRIRMHAYSCNVLNEQSRGCHGTYRLGG